MKDLRRFLTAFTLIPLLVMMVAIPATTAARQSNETATIGSLPVSDTLDHDGEEVSSQQHACHFHDEAMDTVYAFCRYSDDIVDNDGM